MSASQPINRPLFVATIFAGSFLLFLIQPMVARMALPRLGGAPNVWNSAMLVYQALLLAGYAYAHRLSKLPLRRQATLHLALLVVAALTLPIALVNLPPPAPGSEVWWVPLLFLGTVGPVFFLVSAQAPLMQRWYSAHPDAGEPWALYAASNLGSFGGLIAYPLLAEPLLRLHAQSVLWSLGYGLLIVLIALAARARWQAPAHEEPAPGSEAAAAPVPARRFLYWVLIAAIPSGLLLSTTTHLTTDIVAMPLLWVIPLAVYLLSFVIAFSERRVLADLITRIAPLLLLFTGAMAMNSRGAGLFALALGSVGLLFAVSVSLHARMYALRPAASQLTLFYLAMSVGGALGGVFTALIAPIVFDWVWEHPLLVLTAAALMPLSPLLGWHKSPGLEPGMARIAAGVIFIVLAILAWFLATDAGLQEASLTRAGMGLAMALLGLLLMPWRWLFVAALFVMMLAQGGYDTLTTSLQGARARSYFGIYTVRDYADRQVRTLAHGTTLHGQQSLDPARLREPMSYYGPTSGAGLGLAQAQALYGKAARVGVVGLGAGTLACAKRPGESWTFFEIDPIVLRYSRDGTFSYVSRCAPDAKVVIGDARIELARLPKAGLDVLAVDAFSSDAIPLHLLTDEAFGVYFDALAPRGLLLVHISNRFIELEPVLAAIGKRRGLTYVKRDDNPDSHTFVTPSTWVALNRDAGVIAALGKAAPDAPWSPLLPPAERIWSDDHASILPFMRWENMFKTP
jgi:hypothetical protein